MARVLVVTDIAADVAAENLSAVEAAFRALVAWPQIEAVEPSSPDVLAYILEHVAEALRHDPQEMPASVIDALDDEHRGDERLTGVDYAAGAAFVLAHLDRWRERYDRGTPEADGEDRTAPT